MRTFRRNTILMSALTALSAGAAAVASAFDTAEKFVVTGALKVTHVITEQVCDFDSLEQLETYLAAVEDRHNWFRHDEPSNQAVSLAEPIATTDTPGQLAAVDQVSTIAEQIDTTAAQVDTLAQGPAPAADAATTVDTAAAADLASAPDATVDEQTTAAGTDEQPAA